MEYCFNIIEALGVHLSELDQDPNVLYRKATERGIVTSEEHLKDVLAGQWSGKRINRRVHADILLTLPKKATPAAGKDHLFTKVLEPLPRTVTPQAAPRSHRRCSKGVVENLAELAQISANQVRLVVRLMRAEAVMAEIEGDEPVDPTPFAKAINRYCEDYAIGRIEDPAHPQYPQVQVLSDWDGRSLRDLYSKMYANLSGRVIGALLPYEGEALLSHRQARCGFSHPLSAMDSLILEAYKTKRPDGEVASEISEGTGVPVNFESLIVHRDALFSELPA